MHIDGILEQIRDANGLSSMFWVDCRIIRRDIYYVVLKQESYSGSIRGSGPDGISIVFRICLDILS